MAAASLLTLLDDIATLLDDVALMTKVAAKKTAGALALLLVSLAARLWTALKRPARP
jgi:predicted DNA repair protein MutK